MIKAESEGILHQGHTVWVYRVTVRVGLDLVIVVRYMPSSRKIKIGLLRTPEDGADVLSMYAVPVKKEKGIPFEKTVIDLKDVLVDVMYRETMRAFR